MSEMSHRCNTLQTLKYLALGTLSYILNTTIVFYGWFPNEWVFNIPTLRCVLLSSQNPLMGFGRCGLGGAVPPKVGEATPPIHAPIIITFMAPVVELIILLWLISLGLSIEWGFPTSDLPRPLTV